MPASGKITTHVLDLATGRPAAGVRVQIFVGGKLIASLTTNRDGRTDEPLAAGEMFVRGQYRIDFFVGDYHVAQGLADAKRFLDVVPIAFNVDDVARSYHVPLLVSPWAYSTYRGS
jgi:hydroxyisourate hydrolase